jgi:hypothetical protein
MAVNEWDMQRQKFTYEHKHKRYSRAPAFGIPQWFMVVRAALSAL